MSSCESSDHDLDLLDAKFSDSIFACIRFDISSTGDLDRDLLESYILDLCRVDDIDSVLCSCAFDGDDCLEAI